MQKRDVNSYFIRSPKIHKPVCLALATDLHNAEYHDLLPVLKGVDAILIAGDVVNRYKQVWGNAIGFLKDCAGCAPTYFSVGNHERKLQKAEDFWEEAASTGVTILNQTIAQLNDDITLGGFSSRSRKEVDPSAAQELAQLDGYRLLMCHHPEYYPKYVKTLDIDLTVSGHAHGGQVRIGRQGLYAPGQGLLPRLTGGFYDDGRLLVSRGLTNSTWAPRLNNPCELVLIQLLPEESI